MFRPRLIILQPTPFCNIACTYCYLSHRDDRRLMSPAVVAAIAGKLVAPLPRDLAPTIVWHAGEPTAAPIRWYEQAHECLGAAAPPGTQFAMQTNGIAIDDRWIDFFRRANVKVNLSIDGPQRFHDERRRTRNGQPTWKLAMRGLRRLQDAGLDPGVITVLHPAGLHCADEYYEFFRGSGVLEASFSIDEQEGANERSSFGRGDKQAVTSFLVQLMDRAFRDGYPLRIREIERIAQALAGAALAGNELVEPWASVVVAADGKVSTFSPEFMEVHAPDYANFVFGNILDGDFRDFAATELFARASRDVAAGVAACRAECRYFGVCGGGSPVNKYCERGDLRATETTFCRLTTQTAADALLLFLDNRRGRTDAVPNSEQKSERVPEVQGA